MPGVRWQTIKISKDNGFKDFAVREGYHELDVEDCYHKRQIAKVVERTSYVFLVAKIARFEPKSLTLAFDDFDIFIKSDSLVTVEEHSGTRVERVCSRFPRASDPPAVDVNHLVYALLDEIVDYYLVTLDNIGESIHVLEDDVWKNPTPRTLEKIFKIKS